MNSLTLTVLGRNPCREVVLAPLLWISLLLCQPDMFSQRKDAAKAYRPLYPSSLIRESDISSKVLEGFVLVQKANAGDAAAQQELGFRYLEGKGFPCDTAKAAFWISKAADQGHPIANFNLGLLYYHGWGVPWNPFQAYRKFQVSANNNTPDAMHILGLLTTEGLIVQQNWAEAYRLIKRAADLGFPPAKETLVEFQKRGLDKIRAAPDSESKSTAQKGKNKQAVPTRPDTSMGLVFLNFQSDTSTEVGDTTLAREVAREMSSSANKLFIEAPADSFQRTADSSWIQAVAQAAEFGAPEAMVMIGRCFEKGIIVKRDPVVSAMYYIRALRLDSPRAPYLLWNLVHETEFSQRLQRQTDNNETDALYVWAGITALGFDRLLSEQQALQLLNKAVSRNHVPSLLELALCYSSGRWVVQDKEAAIELWKKAASLGSIEAKVRLATADLLGDLGKQDIGSSMSVLKTAAAEGSLEAQTALAYCYEKGISFTKDKGMAATMYRRSAQRGSQSAYRALRRMHDEIRPPDKEFQIQSD